MINVTTFQPLSDDGQQVAHWWKTVTYCMLLEHSYRRLGSRVPCRGYRGLNYTYVTGLVYVLRKAFFNRSELL